MNVREVGCLDADAIHPPKRITRLTWGRKFCWSWDCLSWNKEFFLMFCWTDKLMQTLSPQNICGWVVHTRDQLFLTSGQAFHHGNGLYVFPTLAVLAVVWWSWPHDVSTMTFLCYHIDIFSGFHSSLLFVYAEALGHAGVNGGKNNICVAVHRCSNFRGSLRINLWSFFIWLRWLRSILTRDFLEAVLWLTPVSQQLCQHKHKKTLSKCNYIYSSLTNGLHPFCLSWTRT